MIFNESSYFQIIVMMDQVAIKAPLLHKSMSVRNRLQNGFCGYVLLDLFKLLADKECRRRCLPTGSLWLAPQTHRNMQFVVLGMLSALLSKDRVGNPFLSGHHRPRKWSG